MTTELTWPDIALRLAWTLIAGFLIGLNRGEHGHAAGLRTTVLVCLAAALSMIQVNFLLGMSGRAGNSFVMLDLMRLPLGILSGMGFIGAGAILRRGRLVVGVTTAATLWFVTVLGLCFGGGQILLGIIGLALGIVVLSAFKWLEARIPQDHQAKFSVEIGEEGPCEESLIQMLAQAGFKVRSRRIVYSEGGRFQKCSCDLSWRKKPIDTTSPPILKTLASLPGVSRLEWVG
jgi:putative Mg2+ transporter-C (MgtC) family protein